MNKDNIFLLAVMQLPSSVYAREELEFNSKYVIKSMWVQVNLFEIDCAISYTNLHELLSVHKVNKLGKFW